MTIRSTIRSFFTQKDRAGLTSQDRAYIKAGGNVWFAMTLTTIQKLREAGWSDAQIATYFNGVRSAHEAR